MKKFFFATILTVLLFAVNSFAQACGGSYLNLELIDPENLKTIETANYQLYYVYPKTKKRPDLEEIIATASRFYFGESGNNRGYFYTINAGKFLEVEAAKAENYIKNYNTEDYKNFFNAWQEDHEKQLVGKSEYGKIKFKASETDDTPFLLKIESNNFKPVYLFSNFLGGCYDGATVKIEMKPKVSERKKCLPTERRIIEKISFNSLNLPNLLSKFYPKT
ncbi:MAG: hypothetical protein LUM44_06875 [Pyrinomonadaceae bacterium]|nr:hypothetical protein [Pyrinomonadaceae bacterium]